MKKRIRAVLLIAIFCLSFGMVVCAAEAKTSRLVDYADLLTESEENRLLSILDEISERQQLDIVIVTTNTLDGKSPTVYADDFYDENGYGFGVEKDGVLLLISMEDRDWWISTAGYGIIAFTDAGITYLSEQFLSALSDGDYEKAFTQFARLCDEFIAQARTGEAYDIGELPKAPFSIGYNLIRSLIIGLIIAVIVAMTMRAGMKSVRFQSAASTYIKSGSMNVTEARDLFLYSHVDRKVRQKESSSKGGSQTHTSSSGRTHGGGGGKF
ncbi:MAG: TPM domain-containing protein [Lachnospiraceae bacterium]|nr:TPM domain-containing protein [Lachnospiraceae bacterium]